MTVSTEELELNTLIERLHNPYYTTKDIVDAVLYLLHKERNNLLSFQNIQNMWDSDHNAMLAMHEAESKSINNLNEKIEDAEYRNNKEQQEV